jgi:hypothetical protein
MISSRIGTNWGILGILLEIDWNKLLEHDTMKPLTICTILFHTRFRNAGSELALEDFGNI